MNKGKCLLFEVPDVHKYKESFKLSSDFPLVFLKAKCSVSSFWSRVAHFFFVQNGSKYNKPM